MYIIRNIFTSHDRIMNKAKEEEPNMSFFNSFPLTFKSYEDTSKYNSEAKFHFNEHMSKYIYLFFSNFGWASILLPWCSMDLGQHKKCASMLTVAHK